MTNPNPHPLDALEGLLEERRRYEGWLAHLESRGGEAPSHVVERVRSDYRERLRGVTEQLRGRASGLQASAAEMAGRVAAMLRDETTRRDERAEMELRAAVGEYTPEAASEALSTCDRDISALAQERSTLGAELARVQDVLTLIGAPLPAAAPSAAAEVIGASEAAAEPEPAPPAAPASAPPAAFDELVFLQSVVQSQEAPAPAAPRVDPAVRAADHLPPPVLTAVRRSPTPAAADADPLFGGSRAPSMSPDGVSAIFRDAPTEQVKTLKCQECGTMNYPTEWYCERCGGELATM